MLYSFFKEWKAEQGSENVGHVSGKQHQGGGNSYQGVMPMKWTLKVDRHTAMIYGSTYNKQLTSYGTD